MLEGRKKQGGDNMSRGVKIFLSVVGGLLLVGLIGLLVFLPLFAPVRSSAPGPESEATAGPGGAGLPNPASIYCEEQGGRLEIRAAADGSQYGACVFPDGSECDEWAFYRGECGPGGRAAGPSAEVVAARRDAALAYVREHYGDKAPAPESEWQLASLEESIAPEGSPAEVVYRFTAGDWAITISYPVGLSGPIIYSVDLDNPVTGFEWEGRVDNTGQVTE
jgi:putative hemolysin